MAKLFTMRFVCGTHALIILFLLAMNTQVVAQNQEEGSLDELLSMDFADLGDLQVTLVSRYAERQFDAPAAVYVITQEDIRRSGLNTIPDLLRLVPGMHVGRFDGNKWAIGARNANFRFSDSLLVLMDGRALYTPLFGGTYWDVQDTYLEDIDRIEVIRGPGASLWGANAINGIINVITRKAKDSQGGNIHLGGGQGDWAAAGGFRYGLRLAEGLHGRVYGKKRQFAQGVHINASESSNAGFFPVGSKASDDGQMTQGGFRLDWDADEGADTLNTFSLQGDLYDGRLDDIRVIRNAPEKNTIEVSGANLLGHWKHEFVGGSQLNVQLYFDRTERVDGVFDETLETIDLDMQHNFSLVRQNITWGMGYRHLSDKTQMVEGGRFGLIPSNRTDEVFSLFFQDRVEIIADTLSIIVGAKFEENDYSGFEYQPSLRALWTPNTNHTIWAAVTRSVSTPSRAGADAFLDFNDFLSAPPFFCPFDTSPTLGCIIQVGDANPESEGTYSYELGYRIRSSEQLTVDTALFYDDYFNTEIGNAEDRIYGLELNARYKASPDWRLEFSYTYHKGQEDELEGIQDIAGLPEHSVQLRSYFNLSDTLELDSFLYYVGDTGSLPDYTRLDIRLGWQPSDAFETSLVLTNLLDEVHPEGNGESVKVSTGTERGFFIKGVYRF